MKNRYVTFDEFQEFKNGDFRELKSDVHELKKDVVQLKVDVSGLKSDMQGVKSELTDLKQSVKDLKWFMILPVVLLLLDRLMNYFL